MVFLSFKKKSAKEQKIVDYLRDVTALYVLLRLSSFRVAASIHGYKFTFSRIVVIGQIHQVLRRHDGE